MPADTMSGFLGRLGLQRSSQVKRRSLVEPLLSRVAVVPTNPANLTPRSYGISLQTPKVVNTKKVIHNKRQARHAKRMRSARKMLWLAVAFLIVLGFHRVWYGPGMGSGMNLTRVRSFKEESGGHKKVSSQSDVTGSVNLAVPKVDLNDLGYVEPLMLEEEVKIPGWIYCMEIAIVIALSLMFETAEDVARDKLAEEENEVALDIMDATFGELTST